MLVYIQRQLLLAIPVLVGVSALIFFMLSYIPGQAPDIMALQSGTASSAEELERVREQLGLNDPVIVQYGRFLSGALQGDFGRSIRSNQPVTQIIAAAFPATLQLAVVGTLIAVVIGVTLGNLAAIFRGTWIDTLSMVIALVGWSIPNFWLGIVFILVFSVQLGWFPITGQGGIERLILPSLTLGLAGTGLIARLVRTESLEQLSRDYVTTARAKGLRESRVILRHVFPNSLIPVVTVIGLQFGRLLGGAVIVENVFARQGIGRIAVDALLERDMPVLQGATLLLAVIFILSNLAVDIAYGFLDPRIRIGQGATKNNG
ncbi:MAG: ABC transporter permease [Anaerolineae bacterium]|nr:ABC transporter permease [Anaerolineae bacterium]